MRIPLSLWWYLWRSKSSKDSARVDAAYARRKFETKRAVEALIKVLDDSYERVRFYAAESLGKIRDPRAIDPPVNVLMDTNEEQSVRETAGNALDCLGWQPSDGKWRAVIAYVVAKYLDCGMLKNGFARIRCPSCREEYLLAFSCKGRGFCPSCSAKRSVLWGEFVREKVLADCAHRHLVFSIPKMFPIFFLYNRKLLTELSRCAWKAIGQYFEVCSPEGTLPAGILSIATAGDFLNWNPHIHALVSSGTFHADGSSRKNLCGLSVDSRAARG